MTSTLQIAALTYNYIKSFWSSAVLYIYIYIYIYMTKINKSSAVLYIYDKNKLKKYGKRGNILNSLSISEMVTQF